MVKKRDTIHMTRFQHLRLELAYALFWTLSKLPLCVLYVLSDFLCVVLHRVIRYRVKLVQRHLQECFPEKSEKERRAIEHQFYQFLCDYLVETIRLTTMSEAEIRRRMTFEGMELINEAVAQGKHVSLLLGHYGNWEWITSIGLYIPPHALGGQVYHPLENPVADHLFLRIRQHFHTRCYSTDEIFPALLQARKEGRPSVIGYIADQTPNFPNTHYWGDFLGHYTTFFTGCERISRLLDARVLYLDVERLRRGYYHVRIRPLCDDVNALPTFEPTRLYTQQLEASIRRAPAFWLWSHNRWKRSWEVFCLHFPNEKDRQRIMSKL